MQRFLFWGLVISIHVWMWITASGHRSSFTYGFNVSMKVILDRGTDSVRWRQYLHQWHSYSLSLGTISEDQTHSESAIESCVYITSQLVLKSLCLHRLVKNDINNCFYEGNETAQKLLAELEQCRTPRVVLLKLLMQKWLQNFLRRRRAFQKLVKRFWCFSNKSEWRQRLGGCWRHNWKGW